MKVYFLGTGTSQGVPVIGVDHPVCLSEDSRDKRLRSSVMVTFEGTNVVIDCGPDFRQQMLKANPEYVHGIIFTHEHADHTAGLDDIRPFYFRQGDIDVYAHERVIKSLEKRFDYIFQQGEKYPGVPTLAINEIKNNQHFTIKKMQITPINAWHHRLQVFGFRINDFAYLTDVKSMDKEEKEKLKGLKVLVVNALRVEEHISHFNLEEALAFIKEINPDKAYLTHISHLLGFHETVEKTLPDNVFLAYDNLELNIT